MEVGWFGPEVDADDALRRTVVAFAGPGDVRVGRLCPRCGSAEHGAPWATRDGDTIAVSLSRSGPHLLVAVSDGPVGVDVESVAAVAADWDAGLVLVPGEEAGDDRARAWTWVAKEAVLKAYGVGLARPMTDLRLADFDGDLVELTAPEGYVACAALLRQ